ncbi:hypothetical protein KCV03_g368, partial [Aureobasidium melanogenum]
MILQNVLCARFLAQRQAATNRTTRALAGAEPSSDAWLAWVEPIPCLQLPSIILSQMRKSLVLRDLVVRNENRNLYILPLLYE